MNKYEESVPKQSITKTKKSQTGESALSYPSINQLKVSETPSRAYPHMHRPYREGVYHAIRMKENQYGECMTVKEFIQTNRKEIDAIVLDYYRVKIKNNRERYAWLLDDEGLYRWAHREGVNI